MKRERRFPGFTLLEILLTIVIFSLVGIMAVSFFNTGVTWSSKPIAQLQTDASLQLVLENMIQAGMDAVNANAGTVGNTSSFYGNGANYYVANKMYVCPNANNTFVSSANTQFLLVTIKPSATSGASLTYIFATNSTNNACGS
jgi:prepilin-type N-terminal cleavage/methylation domain-containing protein